MTSIFTIRDDSEFVKRTNIWVEEDYSSSTMSSVDLWSGKPTGGKLVFEYMGSSLSKVREFHYFPGSQGLPIISTAFKTHLETTIPLLECFFFPCDIVRNGSSLAAAWCLAPTHTIWCIDRERSKIEWLIPDLKPEEVRIRSAEKVVFDANGLRDLKIARLRESPTSLIVSQEFRNAVAAFPARGLQILPTEQARFGI
jgi:hypothetical protein